jgi:ATP synthase F1 delta subunit
MESVTVGSTYGTALFEVARDMEKIDAISEEMAALEEIFRSEPLFFSLLCNPGIDASGKKNALEQVFRGKIADELLHFLFILIEKRRIGRFFSIAKAYRQRVDDSLGVSAGTVYSAVPLSEDRLKRFETETGKLIKKNVRLENLTDASILGGVKILIEGKMIDASVRKRLDGLRDTLM